MTPQQRKDLLIRVGKTLFGEERFIAPLARGMGVDASLLVRVFKDERTATDLQIQKAANFLGSEWERHQQQAKLIEGLVLEVTGYPLDQQPHLTPGAELGLEPQKSVSIMIQIIETFPSEIDCHKRWDGTKFTELHRATYQYKVQCLAPIIGKLVLTTIPLETALSANLEIPFTTEQLVVRPCANLSFDTLCFNIEATNENDDRLFAVVALDTKERTAFVTMTVTGLVSDSLLSA